MNDIIQYVKSKLEHEPTGHDFLHAMRVYKNAKALIQEDMDRTVVLAAALLHDLLDHKLEDRFKASIKEITILLQSNELTSDQVQHVFDIIDNISFSKGTIPASLEGKVVQDADRLDALGAIGIARAFSYGGKKERLIYNPDTTDGTDTVSHFYQKLLHLESLMNTEAAKTEAKKRTEYMKQYLVILNQEIR